MRLLAFAVTLLAVLAPPAAAAPWTIHFEALPATGPALPGLADAPYGEREELTRLAADEIVPAVTGALGLSGAVTEVAIGPGGWRLATQASLRAVLAADADEAAARRLAAALGLVFRQSDVLAADLDAADGEAAYGIVALPADPVLTQRFYLHAAVADRGLGGGYSMIDQGMLFLDIDGGRSEARFAAALRRAAARFDDPRATFRRAGHARVVAIEHDWRKDPSGGTYRSRIGPAALPQLDRAAARHRALVDLLAAGYGWR